MSLKATLRGIVWGQQSYQPHWIGGVQWLNVQLENACGPKYPGSVPGEKTKATGSLSHSGAQLLPQTNTKMKKAEPPHSAHLGHKIIKVSWHSTDSTMLQQPCGSLAGNAHSNNYSASKGPARKAWQHEVQKHSFLCKPNRSPRRPQENEQAVQDALPKDKGGRDSTN